MQSSGIVPRSHYGMPAFVTDECISNRHLDKAIPVIKPNHKTIQQGLTGPVSRLKAANL